MARSMCSNWQLQQIGLGADEVGAVFRPQIDAANDDKVNQVTLLRSDMPTRPSFRCE